MIFVIKIQRPSLYISEYCIHFYNDMIIKELIQYFKPKMNEKNHNKDASSSFYWDGKFMSFGLKFHSVQFKISLSGQHNSVNNN
jgi:hypothetical protein